MNELTVNFFYKSLDEGRIVGGKCQNCGTLTSPPRPVCPQCGSLNMKTIQLPNEGTLETFTIIYVPPFSLAEKAPYMVGIVKLRNEVSLMARILGIDLNNLEEIKAGLRVKLTKLREKDRAVLAFKPIQ